MKAFFNDCYILSTAKAFSERSRHRVGSRKKIPMKSLFYAIDSSGVNVHRTINLTLPKIYGLHLFYTCKKGLQMNTKLSTRCLSTI